VPVVASRIVPSAPNAFGAIATAPEGSPELRPRPPRIALYIALIAVIVGMLGVCVSILARMRSPVSPASAPAVAVAEAPRPATSDPGVKDSPADGPKAPLSAEVTLNLGARPGEARLYLDDVPLSSNPLKKSVARDSNPHTLRAEAIGYTTRTMAITFDGDKDVMIALDRSGAGRTTVTYAPPRHDSRNPPPTTAPASPPSTSVVASPPVASPVTSSSPSMGEVELPKPIKKPTRSVDTAQPW
jgi:hypothetical protein